MSRPIQPLGTFGTISVRKVGEKYAATTRYRDMDGIYTRIQATDATETKSAYALKVKITEHAGASGDGDLNRIAASPILPTTGWRRRKPVGVRCRRPLTPTNGTSRWSSCQPWAGYDCMR